MSNNFNRVTLKNTLYENLNMNMVFKHFFFYIYGS